MQGTMYPGRGSEGPEMWLFYTPPNERHMLVVTSMDLTRYVSQPLKDRVVLCHSLQPLPLLSILQATIRIRSAAG